MHRAATFLSGLTTLTGLAVAFVTIPASDAQARRSGDRDAVGVGTVRACSTYGRGCISAKVRRTRLGLQYLSPGGNWIHCEHDCDDTLRRDTIDFWDDQRERSK